MHKAKFTFEDFWGWKEELQADRGGVGLLALRIAAKRSYSRRFWEKGEYWRTVWYGKQKILKFDRYRCYFYKSIFRITREVDPELTFCELIERRLNQLGIEVVMI